MIGSEAKLFRVPNEDFRGRNLFCGKMIRTTNLSNFHLRILKKWNSLFAPLNRLFISHKKVKILLLSCFSFIAIFPSWSMAKWRWKCNLRQLWGIKRPRKGCSQLFVRVIWWRLWFLQFLSTGINLISVIFIFDSLSILNMPLILNWAVIWCHWLFRIDVWILSWIILSTEWNAMQILG